MKHWSRKEEIALKKLMKKGLSYKEIAKILRRSVDSIDSKLLRHRERLNIKKTKTPPDSNIYNIDIRKRLDLIGSVLYWCEGSKTHNRIVEFVNTDPKAVSIFMNFLRSIGIEERRLRGRIKLYSSNNAIASRNFWSRISGIKQANFQKPIIINVKELPNTANHMGTLTIRYHSKRFHDAIGKAIDSIRDLRLEPPA